jgi:MtrB/PioB family decaheme-associated outer membrane protein
MKKRLLLVCLFGLFIAPCLDAEDEIFPAGGDKPLSAEVSLGGRALNQDRQSANFNQYNEIRPGIFGSGRAAYDSDAYHLLLDGAYLGPDDMWARLKAGKWGSFGFSLYYTEFPHNVSFRDRTIYLSPGSQDLTFPGPATAIPRDSALWPSTSFDYKTVRKDAGMTFDLTAAKPFFFNLDANRLNRQGQIPWGGASGLGGFGKTVEFPLAVDDTTTNINATVGWNNKSYHIALSGGFSNYTDHDEFTRFRDPYTTAASATTTGAIVAWPDNKSWNARLTGAARLPLRSNFMVNAGYTHNTSHTNILNTIEGGTQASPTVTTLLLSSRTFDGDVEYWNVNAALTSNPWRSLDTKIYYSYLDRKNNSDIVTFTDSTNLSSSVSSELFSYRKNTIGIEASYRFLTNLKGIVGYEFTDLKRSARESEAEASEDPEVPELRIPDTWDNRIFGQIVYNPLGWLGARLKYQRLDRGAHFTRAINQNPTNPNDQNAVLDNYLRRYYAAQKKQDMFKGTLDLTPLANLDIALEYALKYDDYDRTVLGFTKQKSDEFIFDAAYEWKGVKFFGFFDYDVTTTKQTQRFVNPVAGSSADATVAPNANSYNWNVDLDNKNYAWGIGTSFPIIKDRLAFLVQYEFEKNNGTADFTSQFLAAGLNQDNIDIAGWDDYTRQSLSAKLRFGVTGNLYLVLGYLYSQFKWNDGQYTGYRFSDPAGASAAATTTYLTGAYLDQPYRVNLYYLKATYKF